MKRLITYLLLFTFLIHAGSKLVVYVSFKMNQAYIAENLCENKEKVELECNGHCQLKKELKKDDNRKEQELKNQIEIALFIEEKKADIEFGVVDISGKENLFWISMNQKPRGFIHSVFHPPSLI